MKKLTLIVIALAFTGSLKAQNTKAFNLKFDHFALSVKDIDRSVEWYKKVLGLKEITNQAKKPGMRWLSLGGKMELHLVSIGEKDLMIPIGIHFALATPKFDAFIKRMNEMNIPFEDTDGKPRTFNIRADGVKQIYFQDPDGYWIEANNIGKTKRRR